MRRPLPTTISVNIEYAFKVTLTRAIAHQDSYTNFCAETPFTTLQPLPLSATITFSAVKIQVKDKNTVSKRFSNASS